MPARHVIIRQDGPRRSSRGSSTCATASTSGEFSAEVLAAAEQAATLPRLHQA